VIYLSNHRSNADYVLLGYALAGDVSISYAVGEWARAFPLEYVFKSFGSYFIRRRFREPLYHTVLERYVQLVTVNGVTQGIFPEGGLTRDGTLRPAKIGLLDYMLGAAREDPGLAQRLTIIPVALNYDRVLEDRTLLRELGRQQGESTTPRLTQLREVARYVGWNLARLTTGRWKRYGRAAVTFGAPIRLAPWLEAQRMDGADLWSLPKTDRLARVQALADDVMTRIGALIPVTPVPLACAAIQSFDGDFIPREALLARMAEMRDALVELNAKVLRADRSIEETFDRAYRMLAMRRILVAEGTGFAVMPRQRPLVRYYANSIVHLLGPFARGIRERDGVEIERASVGELGTRN
jgi:glycerol-3-phosphate O-acyltransferase